MIRSLNHLWYENLEMCSNGVYRVPFFTMQDASSMLQVSRVNFVKHCEAKGRKSESVIRLLYKICRSDHTGDESRNEFITGINSADIPYVIAALVFARNRANSVAIRWQYSKSALHPCQFSCSLIASYVPHPIMTRYPLQSQPRRL